MDEKEKMLRLTSSLIKIDIVLPLLDDIAKDINELNLVVAISKWNTILNELKVDIKKELQK